MIQTETMTTMMTLQEMVRASESLLAAKASALAALKDHLTVTHPEAEAEEVETLPQGLLRTMDRVAIKALLAVTRREEAMQEGTLVAFQAVPLAEALLTEAVPPSSGPSGSGDPNEWMLSPQNRARWTIDESTGGGLWRQA